MSGKRLLDAAKLFDAGRSVARQHLVLRREQWDLYTKTSSLGKALKSQTDKVTVTAGAAYELAKRLNETGPVWQQGQDIGHSSSSSNARQAVDHASVLQSDSPGHALRSTGNTIHQHGEVDDGTLASLRKREQQRQAEHQIPAVSAEEQPTRKQDVGQDTFNQRSSTIDPELSSLPRTKLPKHVEQPSGDLDSLPTRTLDQDVYPSPVTDSDVLKVEDGAADGINTDVFTSPNVARMLGKTGPTRENPYASRQRLPPKPLPEMAQASERWRKEREARESRGPSKPMEPATQPDHKPDEDLRVLAAEISRETHAQQDGLQLNPEPANHQMRESRVPSSRFGRIWQYGGLATSMAFGAVGESFRRLAGGSGQGSLMLSESNLNRLVAKLSRMRGAALKLGQMISFQDSKVLPPTINAVLQRVQDSADYMPSSQRDEVLRRNLGSDWRDSFSDFEERPFAAASIGQVHKARLKSNGQNVAVKVQYPGVKNSIDSDLNNLSLLLTASQLLPRGLYLDKTIANARTELGWECDYNREAQAQIRFKDELLIDEHQIFAVPTVYTELSGPDVLTAEFMHGTAVAKIADLTQQERDWIGTQILRLCLRELMEWRFMQTDPNWTNFLYNRETKKVELLDFGASRDFPDHFIEPYVSLLIAASKGDRDSCRDLSIELGYLTGRESNEMLQAHVDSVLTLAEPFVQSAPEVYDFEDQTITDRVRANIGLMLRERLAPPPEETYSLHRKLSGAFLLCARLKSKVPARGLFEKAVEVWNGREEKLKPL